MIAGRLRPGWNRMQAVAELRGIVPGIRAAFPWKMWPDWGTDADLAPLKESLLILLGAAGLVLLIAYANIANLLLASASARQREIAVRAAPGAGHWRITRQLLTESLVLALAGARLLPVFIPLDAPRINVIAINTRVLAFTASLALVTGLAFGVFPALRASRGDLQQTLKSSESTAGTGRARRSPFRAGSVRGHSRRCIHNRRRSSYQEFLASYQCRSRLRPAHLLTARITPNASLCRDRALCIALRRTAAADTCSAGRYGGVSGERHTAERRVFGLRRGNPGSPVAAGPFGPMFWQNTITEGYLHTLGIPLIAGRALTHLDTEGTERVALVNAATARRWWPGQDPLGKRIKATRLKNWHRVVGVAGDTGEVALGADPEWLSGHVYLPYAQGVDDSPNASHDPRHSHRRRSIANCAVGNTAGRTGEPGCAGHRNSHHGRGDRSVNSRPALDRWSPGRIRRPRAVAGLGRNLRRYFMCRAAHPRDRSAVGIGRHPRARSVG
jgi:putative ABC transport system permease protein